MTLLAAAGTAALIVFLAACAGGLPDRVAVAGPNDGWPPAWNGQDPPPRDEALRFDPPSASHCRRAPTTREVAGGSFQGRSRDADREHRALAGAGSAAPAEARSAAKSEVPLPTAPALRDERAAADAASPEGLLRRQRPPHEPVTAGMVDDNADFGEYLAFRQRNAGLAVRDRDVSERVLLEVTDAAGRPVHDAEVAVQRTGRTEPLAWARTDTAGRVWLHPRVFAAGVGDRSLGIAVRKGEAQARAMLVRGQAHAVQVRLAAAPAAARPRLDLVYLVDATGSMDDEIAKLKASMRAVADQIARLPVRPDVCFGLVAYRDRGDAFLTRTHDFTDDLAAFQGVLGRLRAGGGGDKPEALNEALHEVVHGLSWRAEAARMVVLVADAAPHLDYGGPQYDLDMQAALAKGIKVFAVGASGLEPEGEFIYRQMAQYTAGRFVFLTYRDAHDPASGAGTETVHDVRNYSVQTLDRLIVRLVGEELARLARG
jgi:von Willebrand factor type A domain